MDSKRISFDIVGENGDKINLVVVRPSNRVTQDANMAYNLRMSKLIRDGARNVENRLLLRSELEEYLLKMGVWTLGDTVEVEKLALEIRASELMLKKGGLKISEGKAIAMEMAEKRQLILDRHAKRLQFDSMTIESQAENFRFEYLLVKCLLVTETNKPFLKSHDDYVARQEDEAVIEGARILSNIIYGIEDSVQENMFERKWLKDAGMIDSKGRYTGPSGEMVDRNGRLINKDGRYINKDGQLIDTFGRLVDEHGNLIIDESKPFIDDETGDKIVVGEIGKTTKNTTSKKKVTKKRKNKKTKSGS